MKRQPIPQQLKNAAIISLVIHVVVCIFLAFQKPARLTLKKKEQQKKSENKRNNLSDKAKKIYQNSVQVDIVALPEKVGVIKKSIDVKKDPTAKKKTQKKVKKPKQKKETPKDGVEEIKKKKAKAEKERKKKMEETLKKLKKEVEAKEKKEREQIRGNQKSKGTTTHGKKGEDFDQYLSLIQKEVTSHFQIYPWLRKKKLSNEVRIRVNSDGNIVEREITKSSGNKRFDQLVLQAIDNTQTIPPPPQAELAQEEFFIIFKADDPS